jgi:hypothetical protein
MPDSSDIDHVDLPSYRSGYEALARRELRRAHIELERVPDADIRQLLRAFYPQVVDCWETLPSTGSPSTFFALLTAGVRALNTLISHLENARPSPGQAPAARRAITLSEREGLRRAVGGVSKVAEVVACGAVDWRITRLFGKEHLETVRDRFREIPVALQEVLANTWPNFNATFGFAVDPALPAGAGAQAVLGRTDYMAIRPELLEFSEPKLIATLVHEGSHIIRRPTSDFAYRDEGVLYLLSPRLAVDNAAHYEQLAYETLVPWKGRSETPPTELGAFSRTVLLAKLTQAWIRSDNLRRPPYGRGGNVAMLIDARKVGAPLAGALFEDLYQAVSRIFKIVSTAALVLQPDSHPLALDYRNDQLTVKIFDLRTEVRQLTQFIVRTLATNLWTEGSTALDPWLVTQFVIDIAAYYDNTTGDLLSEFYDSLPRRGAAPYSPATT